MAPPRRLLGKCNSALLLGAAIVVWAGLYAVFVGYVIATS